MPPLGFLRSLSKRQGPVSVRPAQPSDHPAIEKILQTSTHAYSGLGGALQEALQDSLTLVAWQKEQVAGFVMAFLQGPEAAWIHALGTAPDVSTEEVALPLLQALEETLRRQNITWIGYMDEYSLGWMRRLLEQAGYAHNTQVIGLETPLHTPPSSGNQEVIVRPAERDDLPAVARLDRAAFGPLWSYREAVLRAVLDQVACFLVAEWAGRPVGYVLGTRYRHDHAHIVRLAVEPRLQSRGIGARLLAEAWAHCAAQGVRWISLNTQEENLRSQRLYHWFGFRPSGDAMSVWAKALGETGGEAA